MRTKCVLLPRLSRLINAPPLGCTAARISNCQKNVLGLQIAVMMTIHMHPQSWKRRRLEHQSIDGLECFAWVSFACHQLLAHWQLDGPNPLNCALPCPPGLQGVAGQPARATPLPAIDNRGVPLGNKDDVPKGNTLRALPHEGRPTLAALLPPWPCWPAATSKGLAVPPNQASIH